MLNTQTTANATANGTQSPADQVVQLPALDLANTHDTFESLITAFDDIATVTGMLLNGNFHKHQQESLLRLVQSYAFEYMSLCESEQGDLGKYLKGTYWDKGGKQ